MKIRISYTFYTDGDYSLRNTEKFGCTGTEMEIEDDYYNYVGSKEFENEEEWRCKYEARSFLEELLCDGIHVLSTHYWLLKDFYDIIEALMDFICNNNSGTKYETLGGNQDGTMIMVKIFD